MKYFNVIFFGDYFQYVFLIIYQVYYLLFLFIKFKGDMKVGFICIINKIMNVKVVEDNNEIIWYLLNVVFLVFVWWVKVKCFDVNGIM